MRREINRFLKNYAAEGNMATAELSFPSEFSGFQGHFPEQPILPGVCQMTLALVMADRMLGRRTKMTAVTNAKFVSVVTPDQPLEITCSLKDDKLTANLTSNSERVGQFKLRIEHA
jgi:3-hydroxyacyl-[acyl-carrier-protein] dehydratase